MLINFSKKYFSLSIKNPYKILGLQKSASKIQIKKAFGELAKKYHPDINPGSSDKF